MSKSLGNFILVHDNRQQIDPQVLRFFMLSVHYRHPINFAQDLVEAAKNGLDRIRTSYANVEHRIDSSASLADGSEEWLAKVNQIKVDFEQAMNDDFNTANAISALFELSRIANVYLNEANTDKAVLQAILNMFDTIGDVLGIQAKVEAGLLDEEIEALIEERIAARKNRDFARSDEIRDQLLSMDIVLEDTRQGTRWKRGQ